MYALFFVRTMNNKKLKEVLGYLIIIVVVVLFRTFLYSPIRVTGDSMVPTLKDGNIMILDKIGYRINGVKRFDIVVVHFNGGNIIKSVIGLPGDYIEYKDDKLYINNKLVNEEYKEKRFYIIDDIYATGNTMKSIKHAIEDLGGIVVGQGVIMNIVELNDDNNIFSLLDINEGETEC